MRQVLPLLIFISAWACSAHQEQKSLDGDTALQTTDKIGLNPQEETEVQETERLLKERAEEDEQAFRELGSYNGNYTLYTESEGTDGKLELQYNGDKIFSFNLSLQVPDVCDGNVSGEVLMDRSQHGFFQQDSCVLHFNFMGNWGDSGFIVEIEQPDPCNLMKGDCIFTGKYITGTAP